MGLGARVQPTPSGSHARGAASAPSSEQTVPGNRLRPWPREPTGGIYGSFGLYDHVICMSTGLLPHLLPSARQVVRQDCASSRRRTRAVERELGWSPTSQAWPIRPAAGSSEAAGQVHGDDAEAETASARSSEEDSSYKGDQGGDQGSGEDGGLGRRTDPSRTQARIPVA